MSGRDSSLQFQSSVDMWTHGQRVSLASEGKATKLNGEEGEEKVNVTWFRFSSSSTQTLTEEEKTGHTEIANTSKTYLFVCLFSSHLPRRH